MTSQKQANEFESLSSLEAAQGWMTVRVVNTTERQQLEAARPHT